jgi:hypothetical protein
MADGIHFPVPDGRTLFVERFGEASPTVVFEPAIGSTRNEWGAVAPVVGRRTSVVAACRARAAAAPQGRHVEAHGSGHDVPFTEPQRVVDEIERILDTLTDEEHIA